MEIYRVAFFGHREVSNHIAVEEKLLTVIVDIIKRHEYVEFLLGNDGEFDVIAACAVKKAKKLYRDDNNMLIWVMPYLKSDYLKNKKEYDDYYDEIQICEESNGTFYKNAFKKRNITMIEHSDFVIFYVEKDSGGAYDAFKYAIKKNKDIINIAK